VLPLILRSFRLIPAEACAPVFKDAVYGGEFISVYLQCKYLLSKTSRYFLPTARPLTSFVFLPFSLRFAASSFLGELRAICGS
jgi:hypothetical protein